MFVLTVTLVSLTTAVILKVGIFEDTGVAVGPPGVAVLVGVADLIGVADGPGVAVRLLTVAVLLKNQLKAKKPPVVLSKRIAIRDEPCSDAGIV